MLMLSRAWIPLLKFLLVFFISGVWGCSERSDRIASIVIHPTKSNLIYVATEEAVYKTRDGGRSWRRLNGELSRIRVMNLLIDPELPANVFAGTLSDGVYKSPDGGQRWLPHNAGIQKGTISSNVNHLVVNPRDSQTLYAATTVGIFRSTDGGQSWTERMRGMTEISFVVALAVNPVRPNVLYAGTSGGVYRSEDSTESWVKINKGLVSPNAKMASMALGVNAIVIDPQTPEVVYVGTTQGLDKTVNAGDSWIHVTESLGRIYISSVVVDPMNPRILYIGTSKGVYKSLSGGEVWQPMNRGLENINIRALRMDPKNFQILYVGTNGGIYRTADGGISWVPLPLVQQP